MFNKFREQTSQFLITGIISLIIIGFMFTGYQSFQGAPDTVAGGRWGKNKLIEVSLGT